MEFFVAPKRSRPQITQRKFPNSGPCTGLIVSQLCASPGGPLAFCESLIAKSLGLAICLHGQFYFRLASKPDDP
jgi:hypothetical protein